MNQLKSIFVNNNSNIFREINKGIAVNSGGGDAKIEFYSEVHQKLFKRDRMGRK